MPHNNANRTLMLVFAGLVLLSMRRPKPRLKALPASTRNGKVIAIPQPSAKAPA